MLRLAADIETQYGRYILNLLKKQYPDQDIDLTATQIGNRMLQKAMRELQNDYHASQDAVQEFIMKIIPRDGPDLKKKISPEVEKEIKEQKKNKTYDPKKDPRYVYKPAEFDFTAPTRKGGPGASTWKQALNNMLTNIRTTAISMSQQRFKKINPSDKEAYADLKWKKQQAEKGKYDWSEYDQSEMDELERLLTKAGEDPNKILPTKGQRKGQRTRTIDEAFGSRGEDGGDPSGGEARMPTSPETGIGKALDDRAAVKEFMELLDGAEVDEKTGKRIPGGFVGKLRSTLDPAELALFDLVYVDDFGGFGSDTNENMGQATALEKKLMQTPEGQAIVQRYSKRWSGFVGDLRKKLLQKITDFVEKRLNPKDFEALYEHFFTDVTPSTPDKLQAKKIKEDSDYQRGIDDRKLARFKWDEQQGTISDKDKTSYKSLLKKYTKDDHVKQTGPSYGWNADKVQPSENPEGSAKTTKDLREKRKLKEQSGDAEGFAQQASLLQIAMHISSSDSIGW